MEMVLNNEFCEMSQSETENIDGGIAPAIIYGGALLGGFLIGYGAGYVLG